MKTSGFVALEIPQVINAFDRERDVAIYLSGHQLATLVPH
jgi:hypothetical protein